MDQQLKQRVDELVHAQASTLATSDRESLTAAVIQLIEREVASVRERAVALCVRRGELWRETSSRRDRLAEEARARSNEAFYLADLLETGQDLPEGEAPGGAAAGGGIEARSARLA
jgi:hypothetical protein